jgi:glyoxylase-like metal-dependent hydrolase (beta-lactamase superfamily II)
MSEVAEGVHRLEIPLGRRFVCVYVLRGEDATIVVDCGLAGMPTAVVAPALARLGVAAADVRDIVVTHADVDHCGGLAEARALWPNATSAAHPSDRRMIEDVDALIEDRYRDLRHGHGLDRDAPFVAWVREHSRPATVGRALADGDRLRLGPDWEVTVRHVPGHTAGHVMLHDPRSRTAIVGDAVLGGPAPTSDGAVTFAPTYWLLEPYRRTLALVASLPIERLLASHEPVLEGLAVERFLAASAAAVATIDAALAEQLAAASAPLTTAELLAPVAAVLAPDGPPVEPVTLAPTVVAHLDAMAAEGRVTRTPGTPIRWVA